MKSPELRQILRLPQLIVSLTVLILAAESQERITIVVDSQGEGHFVSIQDALDSVSGDDIPVTIIIRSGTYREKLFITRSNVALVGEHRDSSRIVFSELRSNWTQSADNRPDGSEFELDWGAAVINIGKGASDIIIANLTVRNDYGSTYGNRDHQFAIRGFDATRISILHCNIISDGGDALALWNRESGMYYHAFSHFEGWVDYVCPRGWCYITNSTFFGHNKTASLWHDGSADRDQKFVIRSSSFDGVPGFPLGRHHRDGQFYLIDCNFSINLADRPIHYPDYSPNARPWIWGTRHYYHNCSRDGGDFEWFSNNLETAAGKPNHTKISAAWTFSDLWDPEAELPPVLPFAALPRPNHNAYDVEPVDLVLRWIGGRDAVIYLVYFGEDENIHRAAETDHTHYRIGPLKPSNKYFWRVDIVSEQDTISGEIWNFITGVE